MSSDVRRTTIEDAVTEAALEVRRNFSPMAADEILIALNSEHMSKARAALYAAVDRTRPPEAARDYDEAVIKAREGSPDPRGRSGDEFVAPPPSEWSKAGQQRLIEALQAAAPATTGARAEAVAYASESAIRDFAIHRREVDDYKHNVGSDIYAMPRSGYELPLYTAPPEVTHGAAIGGDVVTGAEVEIAAKAIYEHWKFSDRESLRAYPWIDGGNSIKQDEARVYASAALESFLRARATASTRSDGGDDGRDAK